MATILLRVTRSKIGSDSGCLVRSSYRSTNGIVLISNSKNPSLLRSRPSSSVSTATTTTAVQTTQRHGPADKMISLNVGGKQFQTLRSTISQNKVLFDHVLRAEANGDPIFIDRDPKHFGIILTYLRNRADGISDAAAARTSSVLKLGGKKSESTAIPQAPFKTYTNSIQLPSDSNQLSELYIESLHYRMTELSNTICSRQFLTRIFNLFGSNNPFQLAGTAYMNLKRMFILSGGALAGAGTWVYAQAVAAEAMMEDAAQDLVEGLTETNEGKNVEFWKKQSKFWNGVAKNWSGAFKNDK